MLGTAYTRVHIAQLRGQWECERQELVRAHPGPKQSHCNGQGFAEGDS